MTQQFKGGDRVLVDPNGVWTADVDTFEPFEATVMTRGWVQGEGYFYVVAVDDDTVNRIGLNTPDFPYKAVIVDEGYVSSV